MSNSLETTGVVEKVYGNNNYTVKVDTEGKTLEVLCHLAGKMVKNKINVVAGDQVTLEIPPPYDKGRIVFRGTKTSVEEIKSTKQKRVKERKKPKGKGGRS